MGLKIIFAGTPEFAVASLQSLQTAGHNIVAAYTQPDRPAGRGRKLQASPVKNAALALDIPVLQPLSLRDAEAQQTLAEFNADVMVVVAYGLILPKAVLATPRLGCLNVHASLLPRWRGAAPIQRAILAGDAETGVCIMQMEAGLDTGPVLAESRMPIGAEETAAELHDRLATAGAELLVTALSDYAAGKVTPEVQATEGVTYADKLNTAEAWLDWRKPASELLRAINAYNPMPVARSALDQQLLKIYRAELVSNEQLANSQAATPGTISQVDQQGVLVQTGAGQLRLLELQPAGKRRMAAADFANSRECVGKLLESQLGE